MLKQKLIGDITKRVDSVSDLQVIVKYGGGDALQDWASIGWKGNEGEDQVGAWMEVPKNNIREIAEKLLEIVIKDA